jgi:putative endonuclease
MTSHPDLPREIKMCYVYVLQSLKDNHWYTGSTNDLKSRFIRHNSGEIESTRHRRPFQLIYYEACLNGHDARLREKYLKTAWGKRYIKNRLRYLTGSTPLDNVPYLTGFRNFFPAF